MCHHHWISGLIIATLSVAAHAEPLVLRNPQWTVEVDPSTLHLAATPLAGPRIVTPAGGHAHRVSRLRYAHDGMDWVWDEGAWQFQVRLRDREVLLWMRRGGEGETRLRRLTLHGADPVPSSAADAAGQQDAAPWPMDPGQHDQIELAALHPPEYRRATGPPGAQAGWPPQH